MSNKQTNAEEREASKAFELLNLGGSIDYQTIVLDETGKPKVDKDGHNVLQKAKISIGDFLVLMDGMSNEETTRDIAVGELNKQNQTLAQVLVGIAEKCAKEIKKDEMVDYGKEGKIPKRAAMFNEIMKDLVKQAQHEKKHVPKATRQRKSEIKRALVYGIDPVGKTCSELKYSGLAAMNTNESGEAVNLKTALENAGKVLSHYRKAIKEDKLPETAADTFELSAVKQVNTMIKKWEKDLNTRLETFAKQAAKEVDKTSTATSEETADNVQEVQQVAVNS